MTGAPARERRLLLELSRLAPRLSADDVQVPGLAWDRIGKAATEHRVGPLVYRNLSRLLGPRSLEGSAQAVADRCRILYAHNLARNTGLYRELQRVLRRLGQAGIPVLVLKGAAMAPSLYGDIGLRHMADLDVLVPDEAQARALRLLADDGYRVQTRVPADLRARARRAGLAPPAQGPVAEATAVRIYRQFHYHYPLRRPGQFFPLELHWHVAKPGTAVDIRELWQSAQATEIAGVETLVLRPEDLLLHLCLHLTGDPYGQLRLARLVDIDLAVTGQRLDWGAIARAAARYRLGRGLRVALGLTRRLLGTAAPDALAQSGGQGERALVGWLSHRWLADLGTRPPDEAPVARALLWRFAVEERWARIARTFYRTAFHYPEDNRWLPDRYRESELWNLVYAFHPSRWRRAAAR